MPDYGAGASIPLVSLRYNIIRAAAHAFYARLGYESAKTQLASGKRLDTSEAAGPATHRPGCRMHWGHIRSAYPTTRKVRLPRELDAAGMDRSVRPGDDFFACANGGCVHTGGIPADAAILRLPFAVIGHVPPADRARIW